LLQKRNGREKIEDFLADALIKNKEKNLKFLREVHYHPIYQTKGPIMPVIVDEISEFSPTNQYVFGRHRSRTTLEQYLFVKYRWQLEYRKLPCIVMKEPNGHKSYYAIETLYSCP
jgi:hypothetical protein